MLGTANAKVRPLKLALLVDPNSATQVREAIRLACCQWGGVYCPIIPLHKRLPASWREAHVRTPKASEVVHGYLNAFDPDILVQFGKELPSYLNNVRQKVVKPEDFWKDRGNVDRVTADPVYGIGVIDLLFGIYEEHFKFVPKFPRRISLPTIPKLHNLFWTSLYGDYPSHVHEAIEREFNEALGIERPMAAPNTFLDLTGQEVFFPRRVTQWETHLEGRVTHRESATVFYMDATKVEDVIDFWNLRATGRPVLPLPKQFQAERPFLDAVSELTTGRHHSPSISTAAFDFVSFVRSRNCSFEEMKAFASTLRPTLNDAARPDEPRLSLQHWYPRFWQDWARSRDGYLHSAYGTETATFDVDEGADPKLRLKPLLPKFAPEGMFSSDMICANEIDFRFYGADRLLAEVFPRTEGDSLSRVICGHTFGEWRVGHPGLVKLVRRDFDETRRVIESEDVFFAWLRDKGWEATLSTPGILAKQVFKQLGGFTPMLANKKVLNLIEHMNGGNVSKSGVLKNERIAQERELAVEHLKSELNGRNSSSRRFEHLVEQGVFKLGLSAQCPTCRRSSWYSMTSLGESLACPKCLENFPAAGNLDQGKGGWSYKTVGPFSVSNYGDGAFSVLLAIDAVAGRMSHSRRTTAVPSFEAVDPNGKKLEADFAMFWQETSAMDDLRGVLFGESKSFNTFAAKDVERMKHIGELFPGAVLVFSTLRAKLDRSEIAAISRLARAGRKLLKDNRPVNPVLVLTEAELLNFERPPHCWSDALRKRFSHVHTLLDWCNASQQIYLGLPSWQEDWAKRMEVRKSKRQQESAKIGVPS